ncbi:hypothetical protein MNBD_BACTEROID06-1594 [hydrothermal vent metagenome]|uniref:Glutamate synthase [NADPH] large chain n=1 Tax=hydrothermal vent metagenome TaxID=652676 RepID=A0A3B0UH21_9ZZZZ
MWVKIFGTSSSEFAGFRLLVFTALFCSLGLALVNYFSKSYYNNYKRDAKKLDSLLLVINRNEPKIQPAVKIFILEKFDPNSVSEEKLVNFGFPTWLAKRLVKYRASGARFSKPTDLLKLYGFSDSLYARIEPYITIKPSLKLKKPAQKLAKSHKEENPKKRKKPLPIFNLNTADTSIFQTINGVGSKLSNRIIEYRISLGGFVSKNQLYQIYKLDSTVVEKISSNSIITIDFEPVKININKATKEQLAAHPYINWTQAKLIIAYRNQHGAFKKLNDIQKVYSIDEDWTKKNAPYLSF